MEVKICVSFVVIYRDNCRFTINGLETKVERLGLKKRVQDLVGRAIGCCLYHLGEKRPSDSDYGFCDILYDVVVVVTDSLPEKIDQVILNGLFMLALVAVLRRVTREHRHGDVFAIAFKNYIGAVAIAGIHLNNSHAVGNITVDGGSRHG
jgi:hypothetical protein